MLNSMVVFGHQDVLAREELLFYVLALGPRMSLQENSCYPMVFFGPHDVLARELLFYNCLWSPGCPGKKAAAIL